MTTILTLVIKEGLAIPGLQAPCCLQSNLKSRPSGIQIKNDLWSSLADFQTERKREYQNKKKGTVEEEIEKVIARDSNHYPSVPLPTCFNPAYCQSGEGKASVGAGGITQGVVRCKKSGTKVTQRSTGLF